MNKILIIRRILVLLIAVPVLCLPCCKKLIEVDLPIDQNTKESAFSSATLASSVMAGIYTKIRTGTSTSGGGSLAVFTGLSGDELKSGPSDYLSFIYRNDYIADPTELWNQTYGEYIFRVNSVIEGVFSSAGISEDAKKILLGEAKFLRAYLYFYLVNIYGDVPLILTTDFKQNSNISRTSTNIVYQQIINDLLEAQEGLKDEYLKLDLTTINTTDRIRPNKAAARAFLARVYLYRGEWAKAADEASKVINKTEYYELPDLSLVFLKDSKEAIWQIQPDPNHSENANTEDARFFIPAENGVPSVIVAPHFLSVFENNDARRTKWLTEVTDLEANTYTIPYKYKVRESLEQTEYIMMIRLAEQYLIRAEARIHNGDVAGGIGDLNILRARASNPAPDILPELSTTLSAAQALEAVAKERQRELFTESGHRWFDMIRTNTINDIMNEVSPQKGGTWAPYKALFPLPFNEFRLNPSLRGHQNPGYNES